MSPTKPPKAAPKRRTTGTPGKAPKRPVRAAIYARISDARGTDTAGVDRQEKDCRALAKGQGWEVTDVYVDNNVSAMRRDMRDRPEGRRLLEDIEAGHIDAVVAYASDRLYRRAAELEYLVDALQGIQVATVRSGHVDLATANGRMIARMLGVVDQAESEVKGERISRAYQERARSGKFGGGTRRFGYNETCTELVPEEADALREAYKTVAKGGSIHSIVIKWRNEIGKGAYGGRITANQVRTALLRPMNAGLAFYKGEEIGKTTESPVIIDEKTWRRVRAILEDPSRRTSPGGKRRLLLSGVLRCHACGGKMSGQHRTRTRGNHQVKSSMYRCITEGCQSASRSMFKLEDAVIAAMFEHIDAGKQGRRKVVVNDEGETAVGNAMSELEIKRAELQEAEAAWEAGEMPMATFRKVVARLNEQIKTIEGRLARPRPRRAGADFIYGKDYRAAWDKMNLEDRRLVVNDLIDTIVVGPGASGKFTMDTVQINFKSLP